MIRLFDRWATSGTFTYSDLAIYRIVYAVLVLISLPQISFVSDFPDSLHAPFPGPFRLLSGVPPQPILFTIQVLLALSLACVAVGLHTRMASLATGVLLLVSFGFLYSFGKVDHTILVAVVPLMLCGSGWGDRLSLDSLRRHGHGVGQESPAQWPVPAADPQSVCAVHTDSRAGGDRTVSPGRAVTTRAAPGRRVDGGGAVPCSGSPIFWWHRAGRRVG